jgi:hypothetical protein
MCTIEGRSRHAAVGITPGDLEEYLPRRDPTEVRFNSSERPASFLSADTTFEKTPAADAPWTTLVEDRHY